MSTPKIKPADFAAACQLALRDFDLDGNPYEVTLPTPPSPEVLELANALAAGFRSSAMYREAKAICAKQQPTTLKAP